MDTQEFRKLRLKQLAKEFGGNVTIAKRLGYTNGSHIGNLLSGFRPITEKFIQKTESKLRIPGWFSEETTADYDLGAPKETAQRTDHNELTEMQPQLDLYKAEMEALKARAGIAEAQAETAKMQARAEIAEAKLEILKPQAENFQLVRDLLKRTEARLTETEKVLNEMQEELITIKKNSQRVA